MPTDIDSVETTLKSQSTAHTELESTMDKEMDSSPLMGTKVILLTTNQTWTLLHTTQANMLSQRHRSAEKPEDMLTHIRTPFMNKPETFTEFSPRLKRKLSAVTLLDQ